MKEIQNYFDDIFKSIVEKTRTPDNLGMESLQEFLAMELSAKHIKPDFDRDDDAFLWDDVKYNYVFLKEYGDYICKIYGTKPEEIDFKFINYGTMALVYVMSIKDKKLTLFLNYPETPFDALKKEAQNLKKFGAICNRVIPPFSYYKNQNELFRRELFAMQYFPQARAISSLDKKFGFYVPEPKYHFEKLSKKASEILQTCMIATLVESYDAQTQLGIAKVEVIGGDFIIEKDWNSKTPTIENTLSKLKLIALRDTVCCPFDEYLNLIRTEFLLETKNKNSLYPNDNFKLSTCNETPFSRKSIEAGINLGLELRKTNCMKQQKTQKNAFEF